MSILVSKFQHCPTFMRLQFMPENYRFGDRFGRRFWHRFWRSFDDKSLKMYNCRKVLCIILRKPWFAICICSKKEKLCYFGEIVLFCYSEIVLFWFAFWCHNFEANSRLGMIDLGINVQHRFDIDFANLIGSVCKLIHD